MDDPLYLDRKGAAAYIEKKYGKPIAVKPTTLAKLASIGGGPVFHTFGQRPAYKPEDLDAWVESRSTGPRRSTSDKGGNYAAAR